MRLPFPAGAVVLLLSGCSFGPPDLAPILANPGKAASIGTIASVGYETAPGYPGNYPHPEDSDDNRMEFRSFRPSLAGIIGYRAWLFVPYVHDIILPPELRGFPCGRLRMGCPA